MDSVLVQSLIQFAGCVATYIAVLIVITVVTRWFAIAVVPLTIFYFLLQVRGSPPCISRCTSCLQLPT